MRTSLLALALLLGACSGHSAPHGSAPPHSPACRTITAGAEVTQAVVTSGCLNTQGGLQLVTAFQCSHGRQLVSVDSTDVHAWGWLPGVWHRASSIKSDPAYAAAFHACS